MCIKYFQFNLACLGPGQNPLVSPNAQSQLNPQSNTTQQSGSVQPGPGSQAGQGNPPANNRASPGPSDESMKKALAALGLPAQTQGLRRVIN